MKKTFYLLIILLSGIAMNAQPLDLASKNLSLSGHLEYSNNLNDVWAYVDSAGHEYALVGTTVGLSIVDLQDLSNPVELYFIPGDTTTWRDIHVFRHYAYVSNEGGNGTLIVDLSGLPENIVYKDTVIGGVATAHNLWTEEGFLYLAGFNFSANPSGGLVIFDLNNNPWIPEQMGTYFNRYVHDIYVRGDTGYSAEVFNGLLTVLDLSNKSNPQVISTHNYPGSFTHSAWLNTAGDVCFTMDEYAQAYTYAWDVSDPTDIRELDRIQSSLSYGKAAPHNVHVYNDFLVNSVYADGVQIVDAARPHNLVEIGHFDTSPRIGAGLRGCWGAYPYLPSGVVLATDMEKGFFILNPNYLRACYLEGKVTDASNGAPLGNVEIEILDSDVLDYSQTTGDYAIGIADSGIYTVIYSKYGYNRESRTVSMTNGQLNLEDVAMTPASQTNLSITVLDADNDQPIADAMIELNAPGGFQNQLTTDQQGIASEANFLGGGYKIIVGKWGFKSVEIPADIQANNSSLTVKLEKGYYDDFTFDFGWLGTQTALSGNWVRDIPIGTYNLNFMFNPDHDSRQDIGERAYITGNGGGNGTNDEVSGGMTTLFSPQIDLSNYIDPVISVDWWMANRNAQVGSAGNDTLRMIFMVGSTEYEIATKIKYRPEWETVQFRVLDYAPLESVNFLKFEIEDISPNEIVEAGVDHFRVIETGWATSLDDEWENIEFKLYPVPVKDQFFVEYDFSKVTGTKDLTFDIYDLQGRKLFSRKLTSFQGREAIETTYLAPGMYIGTISQSGQIVTSVKWLKE